MYSQDILFVLLVLLLSNEKIDLENNNLIMILIVLMLGYPQFPNWNTGCGCNRNRFFLNSF